MRFSGRKYYELFSDKIISFSLQFVTRSVTNPWLCFHNARPWVPIITLFLDNWNQNVVSYTQL